jgi:hypothetical protein
MSFSSIALGGGGVRGGLHIGGLAAIEAFQGHLNFPGGIYGSSVGAIVGTAVAFGLKSSQMKAMFEDHFSLSSIVPSLKLATLLHFSSQKGAFSMDLFEETLINAFRTQGIDLKGKVIGDTPQKLHIFASNMTTQRVTMFSGNVPILDALKCSSCIPFLFHPQIIYNQVYVDGGLFAPNLCEFVPDDCLVFHISYPNKPLMPKDLVDMTIVDMARHIYVGRGAPKLSPNTIWFQNDNVQIMQTLTSADKQMMYDQGFSQTARFLKSKSRSKEGNNVVVSSGPGVVVEPGGSL